MVVEMRKRALSILAHLFAILFGMALLLSVTTPHDSDCLMNNGHSPIDFCNDPSGPLPSHYEGHATHLDPILVHVSLIVALPLDPQSSLPARLFLPRLDPLAPLDQPPRWL